MSFWRQLTAGLDALVNRQAADQEIADEVSHYLDEATAAFVARGLPPEAARRAAQKELGNVTSLREEVHEYGWENAIETFLADLRHATRWLVANPGFTAVSLIVLGLGIGATAAIFSIVEGVLLKPLPYPHSEQLVALLHTAPGVGIEDLDISTSVYLTYGEEGHVFQNVAISTGASWAVTGLGQPEHVPGRVVSHDFLRTLRIQPELGREFTAADENPDSERTVMLTDGYWRSKFGGDRAAIGRHILLDGTPWTIIGVLPPSFEFMDQKISLLAPFRFRRADVTVLGFCCDGIARLKPGVTIAQANADAARILPLTTEKFPMNPGWSASAFRDARIAPRLRPLKDVLVGNIGKTLWVLMATMSIVMLIACANVANLLLVRVDQRHHEVAVRMALGATMGRIVRSLLMESVLLGLCGGALGLGLAWIALRIVTASTLMNLPRMHEVSIDPAVVAFAFVISLAAALLFGLIAAWKYARPLVSAAWRSEGRSLTAGRERQCARGFLVAAQVSLAMILLVGAGLMIRTLRALRHVDPGFSGAAEVETMEIGIPDTVQGTEQILRMHEAILRKMEAIPGVSSVAATSALPLRDNHDDPIYVENRPAPEGAIPPARRFKNVSPGYFASVGTRLIVGRDFTWNDNYGRVRVSIVSENLARELWGNPAAAIGKRIRLNPKDSWYEVIGVAADLHDDGVDHSAPAMVYWPLLQRNADGHEDVDRGLSYIVRTPRAGSEALLRDLQTAVTSVDASLPIADVKTLQSIYDKSLARSSVTLVLLAIAGGMALLLGIVGIYGVISYSVSQRTREIGIRMALGGSLEKVTRLFVRQGVAMCGVGLVGGFSGALLLTGLMKSLLFGVSSGDPLTYAVAAAGLMLAALVGSYLPARRATKVNPVEALRAE
jgi:predicted permease